MRQKNNGLGPREGKKIRSNIIDRRRRRLMLLLLHGSLEGKGRIRKYEAEKCFGFLSQNPFRLFKD